MTMTDLWSFRGVSRAFYQLSCANESFIDCSLLQRSELRLAGRLIKDSVPICDRSTFKHIFRLSRICSIIDKLATHISNDYFTKCAEHVRYNGHSEGTQEKRKKLMAARFRVHLLQLAHYLERYRSYLRTCVIEWCYLGYPRHLLEVEILGKYNHESAWLLCGLHTYIVNILHDRLDFPNPLDIELPRCSVNATYTSFLVLGGIEAIRDCIAAPTSELSMNYMRTHLRRNCSRPSATDGSHIDFKFHDPPRGPLSLRPITRPVSLETAIRVCKKLPIDHDQLEDMDIYHPKRPSEIVRCKKTMSGGAEGDFSPD